MRTRPVSSKYFPLHNDASIILSSDAIVSILNASLNNVKKCVCVQFLSKMTVVELYCRLLGFGHSFGNIYRNMIFCTDLLYYLGLFG
jgi:hypothetical protein